MKIVSIFLKCSAFVCVIGALGIMYHGSVRAGECQGKLDGPKCLTECAGQPGQAKYKCDGPNEETFKTHTDAGGAQVGNTHDSDKQCGKTLVALRGEANCTRAQEGNANTACYYSGKTGCTPPGQE